MIRKNSKEESKAEKSKLENSKLENSKLEKTRKRIKSSTMRTTNWRELNSKKQMAYLGYACSFARKNALRIPAESVDFVERFYAENSIHDPKIGRQRC